SRKDLVSTGPFYVYGANGIIGRHDAFNHEDPQILISCRGTCGRVLRSEPRSWINGNAMVVRSIEERLSFDYLELVLRHCVDLESAINGVAQPQITRSSLEPLELPLPPLEEQRRIADTLDTADDIRRRHLQARDEAKALLAALSAREFTRLEEDASVPMVRLGDVATDRTGGQVKIKKGDYLMHGKVPVIDQGASAVAGYVEDPQACAEVGLPAVLFGDHTRRFKYVDSPFALGADGVKLLEPKQGWDARFLYYAFVRSPLPDLGYSRHFKALKELEFTAPPLDEQRRIADMLDAADSLARRHQAAADDAAALLASLSHDIFTRLEQEASRESA
ncbi:restriction endonuclease subunit S, partial [bacterium]|nr:restriction endonuclease subunit S [bacterium]